MESQVDGFATQKPHTNGTAGQAITREMPSPPPHESRSKLKKLLGRLRGSTTSPSAEAGRGKPTGGVALGSERGERKRGRKGEMETVSEGQGLGVGGVPEPVVDTGRAPALQMAPVLLSRDATAVEGRPPAVTTETRGDIESGEVFWDRVEYIDSQEYKRLQTDKHAPIVDRLESTIAHFKDEPVQRRSLDGADQTSTSPPLHPPRLAASLPAQSIYQHPSPPQMSDGGYSISTTGYPELHLPKNSESEPEAVKLAIPTRPTVDHNGPGFRHRPEMGVAVPGEETGDRGGGRAVPLYDHPEHPIDVTIMRTESQEEEQMRLAREKAEEDVDSGHVPASKGKHVRIEEPGQAPEQKGEGGAGEGGE